jgi:superfamily I DNA/RNA helicase/Zn-dependent peptidase ImmA (M78 family)/CRISPR/Cas system-associated exonuclease Cas4 (RecB family)
MTLLEYAQRPRLLAAYLLGWLREDPGNGDADAAPVDLLAERLGLDVARFHPETRRGGALGWLEPDEDLIYLREGLTEPVRRFTLAHEIGHAVLHRGRILRALAGAPVDEGAAPPSAGEPTGCNSDDLDAPLDATAAGDEQLRPGEAYSARAQRESEANTFAVELLLPAPALLNSYLAVSAAERIGSAGGAVRTVARRFGVSEDVVLRRLAALLVPGAAEIAITDAALLPTAQSSKRADLDAWQRVAAESATPALVIAGPGTGKTSTLVGRVAHLVRERGVAPDHVLALTFSNKAAREMRERLAALLAPQDASTSDLAGALVAPELPVVGTIHAFCGDLLRRYAPHVGLRPDFRLVTETEGYVLLRRLAGELGLQHYQPLGAPGLHFPALLAAISRAKDELVDPDRYSEVAAAMAARAAHADERAAAERAQEVALAYHAYQAALAARGDPDFGDIVRLAVCLLREQPAVLAEVRARYEQVLVDEFQDVNRAMGVLLQTLVGPSGPLWAVGDADQAIYRFRGASPANLARFASEYPGAAIHRLRRNYRSVAPILEVAAGHAATYLGEREDTLLEATRALPGGVTVQLATAPEEAAELAGLADAIRRRVASGRALAEQAVLCRTRRHGQRVAGALNAAGIPAQLAAPLLEQDLVKDVLAVCALIGDPGGGGLLRAGRLPDHAFTAAEAHAVFAYARERGEPPIMTLAASLDAVPRLSAEGARGLVALSGILRELRTAPDVATGLARYLFTLTTLGSHLLSGVAAGDEEVCADALHMTQLLYLARAFDDQRRQPRAEGEAVAAPARGGAEWAAFFDYLRIVGLLRQELGGAVDEAAAGGGDAIRVLTVHASKGLEFPVVYLPGLADRRFPTQRRADVAPLPAALVEEPANAGGVHLLEEACLFYVAVTRARDELVLSHAERYGRMRYKPSPFLAPIAERLGERLLRVRWESSELADAEVQQRTGLSGNADAEGTGDEAILSALSDAQNTSRHFAPTSLNSALLRPSAIETYARCPRQYAYRYVYGLRPREVGLVMLRRSLHDTLRALEERFAADPQQTPAADVIAEGSAQSAGPTLAEAVGLFDARWTALLERDSGESAGDVLERPVATEEPFEEIYRRHGRQVVEQAWLQLAQRQAAEAEDAGAGGRRDYEHAVTVRVGSHDITVTLDRVDLRAAHATPPTTGRGRSARQQDRGADVAEPVRFVRHRLGRSSSPPDLRALFYELAAEQAAEGAPVALHQHNLSTGQIEPLALDARQRAKLTEQLHDALDGIARGDFTPHPEPSLCQSCPFLLICPA